MFSRISGLIKNGSKVAQGIAGMFDPSGATGQKIKGVAGGIQGFNSDLSRINLKHPGSALDKTTGIMGNIGDIASSAGSAIGRMGGAIGGRVGSGMQKAGGFLGMGSDMINGANAMFGTSRAMGGGMFNRVQQGLGQIRGGDFSGLGQNIAGGIQDVRGFGSQMKRQAQSTFGPVAQAARSGKGSRSRSL